GVLAKAPPKLPTAVRAADAMTMFVMVICPLPVLAEKHLQ
ncbi:MAG: hypothetical protein ACI84R_001523, partial [Candidatus Azotimanducaceae bacterium]